MTDSTLRALPQPEAKSTDPLTDLLRAGARDLIAQAVGAELQALLEHHAQRKLPDGRQALVRNGFLPERTIQTGIGDVERALLTDPQTSGGLLVSCTPDTVTEVLSLFLQQGFTHVSVIGEMVEGAPQVDVS